MANEHARLNQLSTKTRRHFVNILHQYIMKNYAIPGEKDIIAACIASIQIFPSLKSAQSTIGGIVSNSVCFIKKFLMLMFSLIYILGSSL